MGIYRERKTLTMSDLNLSEAYRLLSQPAQPEEPEADAPKFDARTAQKYIAIYRGKNEVASYLGIEEAYRLLSQPALPSLPEHRQGAAAGTEARDPGGTGEGEDGDAH
jgi:hypothetical protein